MADQSVVLEQVRRYWEYPGADVERAHELYHEDAVLEFPQSGERFEGIANFTEWRSKYPAEVRPGSATAGDQPARTTKGGDPRGDRCRGHPEGR